MKYLKVWTSFRDVIEPLSDAEKGRLFDMMLVYADHEEEPETFEGNERFVWPAAKQALDLMFAENMRLAENGKKGGRPKTKENQEKPTETNENQDEPNKSQKEKKRKEIERNENKRNLFERFWEAYPRHVAKQDAMKRFEKLDPSEELLETMLKAIEKQKASEQWTKDNGQYIPHPSTWLNQSRWEDELPEAGPRKIVNAQGYSQRSYEDEDAAALARMLEGVTA